MEQLTWLLWVLGESHLGTLSTTGPAWSATWGGIFWNSHSSSPLGCWPRSSRTPEPPEQQSWTQVLLQDGPLSPSLIRVTVLNVLIEKVIFGNILGINRTLDNKFSPHCSSINYFNQIYEVLFGFETSHKLSVIWRPIIHFHMLPIEEKHSRWNVTDVKIVCINWSLVHIYQVYRGHFTQVRRGLRKNII